MTAAQNSTRRLLVKNATIISMDRDQEDLRRGSILICGDTIEAVAPVIDAPDAQIVDATGMIAVPGFVDAHRHVWQGALSMVAADAGLDSYFGHILGKLAPCYSADDVQIGSLVGALQAIDAGVTSIFDWSHIQHSPEHSDAAIEALQSSGIRAVFGYGFPNLGPEWFFESKNPIPEDIRRVRRDWFSSEGLVTMGLALRGPEMSNMDITTSDLKLGRELGLMISVHVGNGDFGRPYRSIEKMAASNLLGPDIQYVHGNSLDDESIRRIADSGGQMVATPTVEMQMMFGYPATTRFLAAGVRPGLGVDVVTSTDSGMFAQMAATFQIARLQSYIQGTLSIDVRDVLSFATLDSARSIGLDHKVGSLTAGKQADVVLLKTPELTADNDPVGSVVLGASSQSVDTVIIGGQIQKSAGRLVRHDLAALKSRLEASRAGLMSRAGIRAPVESFR